jgi:tight adherence protein C
VFNFLIPVGTAVLVAIAVSVIAVAVVRSLRGEPSRQVIEAMPKYTVRGYEGDQVEAAEPLDTSLFVQIGQRLVNNKYRAWLITTLGRAGQRGPLALSALLAKKVTYAIIGAAFGLLFFSQGFATGLVALVVVVTIGFMLPDLLTVSEGQTRDQNMEFALPDAIDLLNLCVESGLSFENAMARVSVGLNGPVAEEFGALINEMQLGKSRIEAMTALAESTKSKGLQRFLTSLLQVDRLGVPISGVLAEQATEMRAQRKDRAREQGQKVTIKILMPLMFCFLPAMFVVILGPAIWQLVQAFNKI